MSNVNELLGKADWFIAKAQDAQQAGHLADALALAGRGVEYLQEIAALPLSRFHKAQINRYQALVAILTDLQVRTARDTAKL